MTRVYIIVGLVILLLLSSTFGILVFKKWRNAESQNKALVEFAASKNKDAQHYKNELGQQVAKNSAQEFDNKTLRRMVKEGAIKLNQFKNVKPKQVEGLGWLTISALDTVKALPIDGNGNFSSLTPFSHLSGTITTPGVLPFGTTITIRDSINIPLTAIVYWHRKGLLRWLGIGRKQYWGEVVSDNPKVTITKLNLVVKKN